MQITANKSVFRSLIFRIVVFKG